MIKRMAMAFMMMATVCCGPGERQDSALDQADAPPPLRPSGERVATANGPADTVGLKGEIANEQSQTPPAAADTASGRTQPPAQRTPPEDRSPPVEEPPPPERSSERSPPPTERPPPDGRSAPDDNARADGAEVARAAVRPGRNEPAGYTVVTRRPFVELADEGWGNHPSGHFTIVPDSSAPGSCCTVGQAMYPAGFEGGRGPARTWYTLADRQKTEVYVSFHARFSQNWQGHSSGVNKILFLWIHRDPAVVVSATGGGREPLRPQFRLQRVPDRAVNFSANLRNVEIRRGQWHHWEIQLISNTDGMRNGVGRIWIDGQLVLEHRNMSFSAADQSRTWEGVYWNPTWGGVGDRVRQDMYMQINDLYVSGAK